MTDADWDRLLDIVMFKLSDIEEGVELLRIAREALAAAEKRTTQVT